MQQSSSSICSNFVGASNSSFVVRISVLVATDSGLMYHRNCHHVDKSFKVNLAHGHNPQLALHHGHMTHTMVRCPASTFCTRFLNQSNTSRQIPGFYFVLNACSAGLLQWPLDSVNSCSEAQQAVRSKQHDSWCLGTRESEASFSFSFF